jgi:inner membrane protein
MTARTHDTAALALLLLITLLDPPAQMTAATALTALIANQLGGIAPDIDQPTAPLWRNLPVGRYAGRVFGALVGGHRFLCHSLLGLAVFAVGAKLLLDLLQPILPPIDVGFVWLAFIIGVVSHLIMDTLTKEGVPWLLPLPFKFGFPPVRAWRVTTGKKVELLVVLPLLVASIVWLCSVQSDTLGALVQSAMK